jgi:hypothetical protein
MRSFLPTARQTNVLLTLGFLALGYAMYLRYLVIEQPTVALACDAGLPTWLCATRRVVTAMFNAQAFGWFALLAALVNLLRPTLVLFALALMAGAAGLVLYNAGLAALALGLLILSLARPAVETV